MICNFSRVTRNICLRGFTAVGMLMICSVGIIASEPLSQLKTESPAEKYIVQQIELGQIADLREHSADTTKRVIRGEFLEELLTGDYDIHRHGIRIQYAQIKDSLDLVCAKVNHRVWLHHFKFYRFVNVKHSIFDNLITFGSSTFNEGANFHHITVQGTIFLDSCVFYGHFQMGASSIKGSINAPAVVFDDTSEVILGNMYVGQDIIMSDVAVNGDLNFQGTHIAGNLYLVESVVSRAAIFSGMKIGKGVHFDSTEFKGDLHLFDMRYEEIFRNSYSVEDNYRKLLMFANEATYFEGTYRNMSDYFERLGSQAWADEVLFAQERRDRREFLNWHTLAYWKNLLLDVLIGYGRRPENAFLIGLVIVLIGWYFVFRKKDLMERCNKNESCSNYNALWYSLDVFAPILNLKAEKYWQPKPEHKWVWLWVRVQTLLGWILIPIGLAAITGLVQ